MGRDTRSTWAKRVEAWKPSRLTAKEFASRHALRAGTLAWWAWRLGKARRGGRSAEIAVPRDRATMDRGTTRCALAVDRSMLTSSSMGAKHRLSWFVACGVVAAHLVACNGGSGTDGGDAAESGSVDAADVAPPTTDSGVDRCHGWDADWGDTPKAEVSVPGTLPCRDSCDCRGIAPCCTRAAEGLVCSREGCF